MGPALHVKPVTDDTGKRVLERLAQIRFTLIHFEHVDSPLFFLDEIEYHFDGLAPATCGNCSNALPDQVTVGGRFEGGNQNICPALFQAGVGLGCDPLPFLTISQTSEETIGTPLEGPLRQ